MKNYCKIVQDLLPNYLEKITSEETNQYMEEHIKQCLECSKIYNEMKEELNISNSFDTEKEVIYMRKFNGKIKRLKLWKQIAIIIITILMILFGIVLYRYSILTKIYKLHSKRNEITNIYYQAEDSDKVTEFWKNGNIIKQKEEFKNERTGGTFWRDTSIDEGFLILEDLKVYVKTPKGEPRESLPWGFVCEWNTFVKRLEIAINPAVNITCKKYNDKDCYYLRFNGSNFLDNTEEIYEIDTGLLLFESGHVQYNSADNLEKFVNHEVKYEYKINEVLDEDVEKPNLSEYELREN